MHLANLENYNNMVMQAFDAIECEIDVALGNSPNVIPCTPFASNHLTKT